MQICITFSGALISNIQAYRYQSQISKIESATQLSLPIATWNRFDNKKEIELNGDYYDVISIEKKASNVVLKVVKDDFESEFRLAMHTVFDNKAVTNDDDKKSFNCYDNPTIIEKQIANYDVFFCEGNTNCHGLLIDGKTQNTIVTLYKPPC